ncbi:hypothetical protein M758_7G180700 [Ceratodon purpureus]|nr:hypothetical protein M758_7G180700 [Ceratodon purpureus]
MASPVPTTLPRLPVPHGHVMPGPTATGDRGPQPPRPCMYYVVQWNFVSLSLSLAAVGVCVCVHCVWVYACMRECVCVTVGEGRRCPCVCMLDRAERNPFHFMWNVVGYTPSCWNSSQPGSLAGFLTHSYRHT